MKRTLKKLIALTLTLVMVFGAAPLNGFVGLDLFGTSASAASVSNLSFRLINNGTAYEVSDCDGEASGELIIPSTYNGLPVTSIGDYAFLYCNLTSITIPDSVTSIGHEAFADCKTLTGITVSSNNAYFSSDSYGVLYNKDKTELIQYPIGNTRTSFSIPDSVTSIGTCTFWGCDSLTSITIPDSVTSTGDHAFAYCDSLTSITIPDSVTRIGDQTFAGCDSLTSITVLSNNAYYSSDEYGVLYDKDKTELIQYPIGNARDLFEIPTSVTSIGNCTFLECDSLTSIIIPDSVTSIGYSAFEHCNGLTSITIPDRVTSIGIFTFRDCDSLTSIIIPNSVTSIGDGAFDSCTSLTDVYYSGTEAEWNNIYIDESNEPLLNATIHFESTAGASEFDIYNLGEETYSFDNFGDSDSSGGHCFGMSMTSSAYHLGLLDITDVGGNSTDDVYALSKTERVKQPICHYQKIQGSTSVDATVAGGKYYKYESYDINSDWAEVINYVKSHQYDDTGALQIGFRKKNIGGHAINFLRYQEVNGEQRIYAYDNNFPGTETYFYKSSDGKIYQAPNQTFSGSIDCIALRSVSKYFSTAGDKKIS